MDTIHGVLIAFSIFSFLFVYLIQRLQGILPLNPQGFNATNVSPDLALNTAVSFLSNTNWQSYSGESTLGYLVQMAALTVQNFASPAAGIAVAVALVRGFSRQQVNSIGNFWVDLTRATLYILLPISVVAALFFLFASRRAKPGALYSCPYGRRRKTGDRAGSGGLARSHQDAWH